MALLEDIEDEPELIYELIISIINILSICSNILLIVVIVRSKAMRTKTNIYILNVAVVDLFILLVLLVYIFDKRVIKLSYHYENYNHIQCTLTNLELSFQITSAFLVLFIAANCLYKNSLVSQGSVLIFMWNFEIVLCYINFQYCKPVLTYIQSGVYVFFMTSLLIVLVIKCYLRCKDKGDLTRDGAFRLNFATIYVCLCLSSWIVNIIAAFSFQDDSIFKHFVLAFGTSVKVGKNIALTCYLIKFHDMFKESFLGLFNCRTITINDSVHYSTDQTSVDISMRSEKIHI